ncbi:MAG: HAMP domain-containing histidine kinase, partial [Anaerolineae bacterium]|nr:HAMP domain-containing histidine kinase [Anaerolineae bacterium]
WVNYLTNALKYGGTPPILGLGYTHAPPKFIRFWIKDNGPGLSKEHQREIFTEFTRLDESGVQGHGLGLATVRRIIEKLNGDVGVESTPGQGSTFYFTLPTN